MSLQGKTIFLTGATSGIGNALAKKLDEFNCHLIISGRRKDRLDLLRTELKSKTSICHLDLSKDFSRENILEQIQTTNIDCLINCAAHDYGGRQAFVDSNPEEWTKIIQANLIGLMRLSQIFLPGMKEKRSGDILNVSSTNIMRPVENMTAYSVSKNAVHSFTEQLRFECAQYGLRIMEIVPGITDTEFAEVRFYGDKAKAKEYYKRFPKLLKAEEVADTIIFALDQPVHINIAQLTVMPQTQF